MNKYRSLYNTTLSLIINLLLVMGCFILCRVIFLIEKLKAFSDLSAGRIWRMFEGGFLFDTSAILYTNLLYIFLMLIPLHYKENVIYQNITRESGRYYRDRIIESLVSDVVCHCFWLCFI